MDVIQRAITAAGVSLYSGEVVDASVFPNMEVLRTHGYIKPFAGKAFKCKQCKRVFTTAYVMEAHMLADHEVLEEAQNEANPLDLIPASDASGTEVPASSPAETDAPAGTLENKETPTE